jgi:hypothetical protein
MAVDRNGIDTGGPLNREASVCAVFSSLIALDMEVDKASVAVPMICLGSQTCNSYHCSSEPIDTVPPIPSAQTQLLSVLPSVNFSLPLAKSPWDSGEASHNHL